MEHYETDEQRGEAFKNWLLKNSGVVLLGVAIGIGGIYASNHFRDKNTKSASLNGEVFGQLLKASEQNDSSKMDQLAASFKNTKDDAGYWDLTQLNLAKLKLEQGHLGDAIVTLKALASGSVDTSIQALAQYRIGLIYFEQNKAVEALSSLSLINVKSFQGIRKELEGDIYLSQAKVTEAIDAFKMAKNLGNTSALLKIKFANLGLDFLENDNKIVLSE
ncbi:hypothetical protein AwWohl_11950 [Gammaproteobacteria bacterium]|nr:hypothetical protein AwWohl_11950 [Gammaproteobacteria bacterium]